jgi:Rieske Fe-S protein
MGRRLDLTADNDVLECCSISKSRFDHEGGTISGPGSKPLRKFPVEAQGKRLIVTLT